MSTGWLGEVEGKHEAVHNACINVSALTALITILAHRGHTCKFIHNWHTDKVRSPWRGNWQRPWLGEEIQACYWCSGTRIWLLLPSLFVLLCWGLDVSLLRLSSVVDAPLFRCVRPWHSIVGDGENLPCVHQDVCVGHVQFRRSMPGHSRRMVFCKLHCLVGYV